jgi:glycosyltransferase involved in cell wall biosynthesis
LATAAPEIGLLSTYPPTRCGLAYYSQALRAAMVERRGVGRVVGVVRVGLPTAEDGPEVRGWYRPGHPGSTRFVRDVLNRFDAVVIQHEYGIYGPDSGIAITDLIEHLQTPLVVTAHTVLSSPTPRQKGILEVLGQAATALVVMSQCAAERIVSTYDIDARKLAVLPHGTDGFAPPGARFPTDRASLMTWGLVGPGKGIEYAIEALSQLRDLRPRYLVAGRTHPSVLEREGEAYRISLQRQAESLGVGRHVDFFPHFLRRRALLRAAHRADVILLPYESTEQVTSGVLVEAVASGVPVVATAFPHAVELAREGAVLTVPHRDPAALAHAIRTVIASPELRARMLAAQRRVTASHTWSRIADGYLDLVGAITAQSRQPA